MPDDYIKRSVAKKILSLLPADLDAETVQRCIEAIGRITAAEVEPIVYCKDCEFAERCFRNLKFINEDGSTSTGVLRWCSIGREKDEFNRWLEERDYDVDC